MKRLAYIFSITLFISACGTLGHQEFYTQVSPSKYPKTEHVYVFAYGDEDLETLYNLYFSDFLKIGKSSFNGSYEEPSASVSFAKSIGANVFITNSRHTETRHSTINMSVPTSNTTNFSAYGSGGGYLSGTATTYGSKNIPIPITTERYDQDGIYLRNVNNVLPIWEKTKKHYPKDGDSPLTGLWKNENYIVDVYQSGIKIVGFVSEIPEGSEVKPLGAWSKDQLKFAFDVKSSKGVYLMGNKAPVPADIKINKFNHLELSLFRGIERFSFSRVMNGKK